MARPRKDEFSKKTKVEAYKLANGKCRKCGSALQPGRTEYHHILEVAFGGTGSLANCMPLCTPCHGVITATESVPQVAKSNRQRVKHVVGKTPSSGLAGRSHEDKEADRQAKVKPGKLPMPARRKDIFGNPL